MHSDVVHAPFSFPLGPHWVAQNEGASSPNILITPQTRHLEFMVDLSTYEVDHDAMEKLLKQSLKEMLQMLQEQHVTPKLLGASEHERCTVYTGTAGIVYTLWRVKQCGIVDCPLDTGALREIASTAVKSSDSDSNTSSLLTGKIGVMAVECLVREGAGLDKLLTLMEDLWVKEGVEEEEVLFGKAGFLQVLLFLREISPKNAKIVTLAKTVIQHYFDREDSFLTGELQDVYNYFQCHNKCYFGAAHGIAGVVYTISCFGKDVVGDEKWNALVEVSKKLMTSHMFEGGNMPSSLTSEKDKLVHWCHGSPGFLLLTSKLGLDSFSQKFTENVWKRGLLHTKGPGLCHGVSGNGYCMLSHYSRTKDELQLKRALFYADFLSTSWKDIMDLTDKPYSLYTGICGAILYLMDCIRALRGSTDIHFPCYEY